MKPSIIIEKGYKELWSKAEGQHLIAERMFWLYQKNLDFDFYDIYLTQLAGYARQIQQLRSVNPHLIELKIKAMLAEVNKLWPEHGTNGITPELVARVTLLLDKATAMGWKQLLPEAPIYNCEVCGLKGHLGVDIVERPYYDRVFKRDSTRWECKDIEKCLDRIGR